MHCGNWGNHRFGSWYYKIHFDWLIVMLALILLQGCKQIWLRKSHLQQRKSNMRSLVFLQFHVKTVAMVPLYCSLHEKKSPRLVSSHLNL
jgi:hypothetical protein